jgi:hypothetical protein
MALVSDLNTVPLSGYTHIDALLDQGPDWNYITPYTNTILYTFSVASGNESDVSGQVSFSASQRTHTVEALRYLGQLTGIKFVETTDGNGAQLHFANVDITHSPQTTGLCSWRSSYSYIDNTVTRYEVDAYVYLDNREFAFQNTNLTPGTEGYETLLHELGHALGLKHPFETTTGNSVTLPSYQDNTSLTLMSYRSYGGPYAQMSHYDVAALMWLYGGDGLGGKLGADAAGRFLLGTASADNLTGTAGDDVLMGVAGNDVINGGTGNDTAEFTNVRSAYLVTASGSEIVIRDNSNSLGNDGSDRISNVELFRFSDGTFTLSQLLGQDKTAPAAPWISVQRNEAGYTNSNTPSIFGVAEANATVQVLRGATVIATTTANSTGSWDVTLSTLADGSYTLTARAVDAAGNVSMPSTQLTFAVDERAPTAPTIDLNRDASGLIGGSRALFTGTGEAGATIRISEGAALLGTTVVAADGSWTLETGALTATSHTVTAVAVDAADNASPASAALAFRVDTRSGFAGTSGADNFGALSGSNVYDGRAGIDSTMFGNARANFTVTRSGDAVTVADRTGGDTDTLFNVERLQFGDSVVAVDIDGNGGQAYRIYNAVLDRTPDAAGLGFWIEGMDDGMSLREVAGHFIASNEFRANFGENLSNSQLVNTLYQNILDRAPEQAGVDYWVGALDAGVITQAEALAMISESTENRAKVDPAISNGFVYDPWA